MGYVIEIWRILKVEMEKERKGYNIWHLMVIFSILILIQDIFSVYFENVANNVMMVVHTIQIISVILFLIFNKISLKKLFGRPDIPMVFLSFFCGVAIMVLGSCLESVVLLFIPQKVENTLEGLGFTVFFLVFTTFFAPLFEEIEFRGLLFPSLYNCKKRLIAAIAISSFMFMMIHTGSVNFGAIILAVVSCVIYYKTKNLMYSVIMHFSGNMLVCLSIFIGILGNGVDAGLMTEETNLSANEMLVSIIFSIIIFAVLFVVFSLILSGLLAIMFYRIKTKNMNVNTDFNGLYLGEKENIRTNIFFWLYIIFCTFGWVVQMFK